MSAWRVDIARLRLVSRAFWDSVHQAFEAWNANVERSSSGTNSAMIEGVLFVSCGECLTLVRLSNGLDAWLRLVGKIADAPKRNVESINGWLSSGVRLGKVLSQSPALLHSLAAGNNVASRSCDGWLNRGRRLGWADAIV